MGSENINSYQKSLIFQHVLFIKSCAPDHLRRSRRMCSQVREAHKEEEHVKAVVKLLWDGPYESFLMEGGLLFKEVDGSELLSPRNSGYFALL